MLGAATFLAGAAGIGIYRRRELRPCLEEAGSVIREHTPGGAGCVFLGALCWTVAAPPTNILAVAAAAVGISFVVTRASDLADSECCLGHTPAPRIIRQKDSKVQLKPPTAAKLKPVPEEEEYEDLEYSDDEEEFEDDLKKPSKDPKPRKDSASTNSRRRSEDADTDVDRNLSGPCVVCPSCRLRFVLESENLLHDSSGPSSRGKDKSGSFGKSKDGPRVACPGCKHRFMLESDNLMLQHSESITTPSSSLLSTTKEGKVKAAKSESKHKDKGSTLSDNAKGKSR